MSDPWHWWREAVEGRVGPIHDEAVCGYFKVRDRRGEFRHVAPIKRPWVPVAIWQEGDNLVAELAGEEIAVDAVWPYAAKYPVSFEAYHYWHMHDAWPSPEELKDYAA